MDQRNDMSYWWPIASRCMVPVPRTVLVTATHEQVVALHRISGGECEKGDHATLEPFIKQLQAAARWALAGAGNLLPGVFLRGGHFSGKHDWEDTCFVREPSEMFAHVLAIVEAGEMASPIGFPLHTWAVRELLDVQPRFHAFRGRMPIVREFRFFAEDGAVLGWQPYWPKDSIERPEGCDDWERGLQEMSALTEDERLYLFVLASSVSAAMALSGDRDAWSIDFLQDRTGKWWMTDMALMADSFISPDAVWEAKKGDG